jgi:uncharacterized protein YqeY
MTTLQERIGQDWQRAMKERSPKKDVLSLMRTELKNKAINTRSGGEGGVTLGDSEALDVLRRMAKQRKESIESFTSGGRDDLVQKERFELEVIESYLPAQMSEEAVENLVRGAIARTGASSIKDLGRVMGVIMAEGKGQLDGNLAQAIAKRLLGV